MRMDNVWKSLAVTVALVLASGCGGSSSQSVRSTSNDTPPINGGNGTENGNGVDGGNGAGADTIIEGTIQDVAGITDSAGNVIQVLGGTISQTELPLIDSSITDSAGNIVTNLGDGVESLSAGLADGLGSISENDNALGTTLAGVSGLVSETGEAVSSAGTTVENLNTLPVFAQLDENSGLLTTLGGTVDSLGALVTEVGDVLTLTFTQDDGTISGLTTELTAVVRPLLINIDGTTKVVGEAVVVAPVITGLIAQVGSAVVVLGNQLGQQDNMVLASAGGVVENVGFLLVNIDGNLFVNPDPDSGFELLDLGNLLGEQDPTNLLAELLNGGDPVNGVQGLLSELLGQENELLAGLIATLNSLVGGLLGNEDELLAGLTDGLLGGELLDGGNENILAGVTDTVEGLTGSLLGGDGDLTGGLLGGDAGLVGGLTETVNGLTGDLLGGDEGLVGGLVGTVDGLTGGLLGDDAGLVGGLTDTVDGLTGGLLGDETGLVGGLTDTVGGLLGDDAGLVDGLTGDLLNSDEGLVDGLLNTVGGLTGGLL